MLAMSDNIYTLNPHPLSGPPMPPAEYRKAMINWAVIVVAVIAVIGIWFWWSASQSSRTVVVDQQAALRAEVAAILRSSTVQPSQAEIDSVASVLSKSKTTASAADRQAVAAQLRASVSEH